MDAWRNSRRGVNPAILSPDSTTLIVSLQERVTQLEQRLEEVARDNQLLRHKIQLKWLHDELKWRDLRFYNFVRVNSHA